MVMALVQVDVEDLFKAIIDDAVLIDELEKRGHQIDHGLGSYDDESLIESLEHRGYLVVATEPAINELYEALHLNAPDAMDKVRRYVELATGRII